jgi:hypothetical protein
MFRVYRGLLVFCFFIVLPSQAQLTLQGGVGVGAVLPAGDLGGATTDYYAGTKYGLSTGYNAHAKARLGALGFRFAREISYSSLSNSGNSEPGQGNVDTKQKIVSFSVGPEYSISIPLSPITPYFGAHAALHLISGETTFQGVSKVPSGTFTLQSGSRLGVGGTAGVVLGMGPLMNLDIAAHYEAMNPFSKSWEDANTSADQRIDSYLTVNDDKDPQYAANNDKHFIAGSRSISVLSFTVTLMFGL